jgi:predicted HTH domain antitoxin
MTCNKSSQIEIELTAEEAILVEDAARIAGITTEELLQIALNRLLETARAASV